MKGFLTALLVCGCITSLVLAADQNLVALHKSTSPQYNPNCLTSGCHDQLMASETSLDPRVPGIHQKMVPYVPGYNPRKGVTDATCRHCHRSVDLLQKSAAALRKNVSPQNCAVCHTAAGPGKPLYQ